MKKLLKNIFVIITAAVLLASPAASEDLPFTDIPEDAWYYVDVETAYNTGLINGKSATTFAPNSYLTYAEAVKLAACMNQLFTIGEITLVNGNPWYQSYVDYLTSEDVISREYEWGENATRAGYMEIFAAALPDEVLERINNVPYGSIPDVPADHPQAVGIYKLYRAGILQGSDPITHACNPDTSIRRSEVAAIIARITNADKRIAFTMKNAGEFAFEIEKQPASVYADSFSGLATFEVTASGEDVKYDWQIFDTVENRWVSIGGTKDSISVDYTLASDADIIFYRCLLRDGEESLVTDEVCIYPPLIQVEITKKPADLRQLVSIILEYTSLSIGDATDIAKGEEPIIITLDGGEEDGAEMVELLTALESEARVKVSSASGLCFVRLSSVGENVIEIIKLIDEYTDCGLTKAQHLVKGSFAIVGRNMTQNEAEKFAAALRTAGAECEIK